MFLKNLKYHLVKKETKAITWWTCVANKLNIIKYFFLLTITKIYNSSLFYRFIFLMISWTKELLKIINISSLISVRNIFFLCRNSSMHNNKKIFQLKCNVQFCFCHAICKLQFGNGKNVELDCLLILVLHSELILKFYKYLFQTWKKNCD